MKSKGIIGRLVIVSCILTMLSCAKEEEEYFYQSGSIDGNYIDLKSVSIKSDYESLDDSYGYSINVQSKSGKYDFDFICVVYEPTHWKNGGTYKLYEVGQDNRWLGHAIYTTKVGDEYRVESFETGSLTVWEINESINFIDFSFRGISEDGNSITLSYDGYYK
ncbi:hypothetical protein [Flagellimonas myxillae]|uniref:hypothetical protein n=1 Tax=Flagellimonas myxillae TaxID=2942214 RepID=UPI00201FABD4|nr:hypothetical protein [Muricauda myxillae]MCL6267440.1 hypothetical protein [Muricauda myxillae]